MPTDGSKKQLVARVEEMQAEQALHAEREAAFSKMTIAQMQDCLRLNGMVVSGVKVELVRRCVDASVHGVLPRCPLCTEGRLRVAHYASGWLHGGVGKYTCSGTRDGDGWNSRGP